MSCAGALIARHQHQNRNRHWHARGVCSCLVGSIPSALTRRVFATKQNDVTRKDELAYLLLLLPDQVVESSNASLHPFSRLYSRRGGRHGGKGRRGNPLCFGPLALSPRPAWCPWEPPLTPSHLSSLGPFTSYNSCICCCPPS